MIGHNNGPPLGDITDVGDRARLYYWRKAHKAAWRTPPIEIVRLRHRAAEQLGLSYRDYTAILLDRGRRPDAIVFALEGTLIRSSGHRLEVSGHDQISLMPGVQKKLQRLTGCAIFVVAGQPGATFADQSAVRADRFVRQMGETCGIAIADASTWCEGGGAQPVSSLDAVNHLLAKHRLVPSQTVFVGTTAADEKTAEAAGLARFLWAWHYFAEGPAGTS